MRITMSDEEFKEKAIQLLQGLKRDLMYARRFSPDTLDTYRRACTSAECDIEVFLKEATRIHFGVV